MSYYVDLSKYIYLKENLYPNALNVGWLDDSHTYSLGEVSEDFIDRLFDICCSPILISRGWHPCPFCSEYEIKVQKNDRFLVLGSAEIIVHGKNAIYISPDLVYHYVIAHRYCPPKEFIDAVIG